MGTSQEGDDSMTRGDVEAVYDIVTATDEARQTTGDPVPDDRLIPFYVVMPDGYSEDEQAKWSASISEALQAVAEDAKKDIAVDRTIKVMEDLGLGDGR